MGSALWPAPNLPSLPGTLYVTGLYETALLDFLAAPATYPIVMPLVAGRRFVPVLYNVRGATRNANVVTQPLFKLTQNGVDVTAQFGASAATWNARGAIQNQVSILNTETPTMDTYPISVTVNQAGVGAGLTDFTGYVGCWGYYR